MEAEIFKPDQALTELTARLNAIKVRAEIIVVHDADSCAAAKSLELEIKAYLDAVELSDFARDVASKKFEAQQAANALKELQRPGDDLRALVKGRRTAWEMEGRRKAQLEQDRINAENKRLHDQQVEADRQEAERIATEARKATVDAIRADYKAGRITKRQCEKLLREAGSQKEADMMKAAADAEEAKKAGPAPVKVAANIPKMQGVQSRVNWKFEVTDETKVGRPWCDPSDGNGGNRIGEYVRKSKSQADGDAAAKLIGGIKVWQE